MKQFILLCACLISGLSLSAQMPSMKVIERSNAVTPTVELKDMDIRVEIIGNVATTTMKMVFHNQSKRILEGELTFPMPEGVTVSGYALDINGKMRKAVPVEKAKATEVFESIEHRNVDPGILEKVSGNNFRTRIYPLPANGERTIEVTYEEALPLKNGNVLQYNLPLKYAQTIPSFKLKTIIYQSNKRPQLVEQPDGSFSFTENNGVYEGSLQKTNFKPEKALIINLPKETNLPEIVMQKNRDGSHYFLINAYPKKDSRDRILSNHIGIIWDNSMSSLQRDKEKDLAFLNKLIQDKKNLTIDVGLLNIRFTKTKTFKINNGNWSELKNYLQNTIYDGGTDYSQVKAQTMPADEYLLFSEGLSTFGESTISLDKKVHCICSSMQADFSTLKVISMERNGIFINLSSSTPDEALRKFKQDDLQFLGIKEHALVSEVYPSLPTATDGHIAVSGICQSASGELTLQFGHGGKVESEMKVKLQSQANDINVNHIWAQMKIAEMDIQYDINKGDIEALGKQFGIVTRGTSLMVLDDVRDYARYGITPPDELRSEYDLIAKGSQMEEEERVNGLLSQAIEMIDDLKTWWNTTFKADKIFPTPDSNFYETVPYEEAAEPEVPVPVIVPDEEEAEPEAYIAASDADASEEIMISEVDDLRVRPQAEASPEEDSDANMYVAEAADMEVMEVVSMNQTAQKNNSPIISREQSTKGSIKLQNIRSDKDYMQKLAAAQDAYAEYLSLRNDYHDTPDFYFDASQFFYDKGNKELGLLILSNLAELDLENAELFKTLAYKMKEKGEYKLELFLTEKILEWRPMDPQSHRDYALALQDNHRYQEALDELYSVLTSSYSSENLERNHDIEETIVCELNNLITLHRKQLNISHIDSKLIANLPVDIRVVINWNKNDTDIDLWVTDPNGEMCFYRNNRTSAGGRLSKDFTTGFGPEQFLLKKAIKGKYKIETNLFNERQLTLSGPTTIMAEIYLHYSDGHEERKVITFQSDENEKERNGILIGEFTFGD